MSLTTVLIVIAVALIFEAWRSHARLRDALRPRKGPAWLARYPSVTVIRPIRGLDFGAEENIRAALETRYPGAVTTLFVFDDAGEPAVPIAREAIARCAAEGTPVDARIVFCGPPPSGRTGKLNAMIAGMRESTSDLYAFVDSDVRPDPFALKRVVETLLADPTAGAAFAPVVVTEPPRTVGDVGYALLLNGLYGPALERAAADSGGSLPFIMGQHMVLRPDALRAIGGLESLTGQLVDDMALGARFHQFGFANRVSPHSVPILQCGLTFREFWSVFVRWITFSRTGLAGRSVRISSIVRALVWWVGFIGGVAAAAFGLWPAAAVLLAAPVSVSISINRLHERIGGAPLRPAHTWVSFALMLLAPVVYAATLSQRNIAWRGRTYDLDADSRLDATAEPHETNALSERI